MQKQQQKSRNEWATNIQLLVSSKDNKDQPRTESAHWHEKPKQKESSLKSTMFYISSKKHVKYLCLRGVLEGAQ